MERGKEDKKFFSPRRKKERPHFSKKRKRVSCRGKKGPVLQKSRAGERPSFATFTAGGERGV